MSSAWPPAGLALAALVLLGVRAWPGIALGALIANLTSGVAAPAALAIAAGNTLEALAGWWLLRTLDFRPAMDRLRDVLVLALVAGTVTAVSATIGVASLWLSGATPPQGLGSLWLAWWTGDAIGVLTVAPLLFTWVTALPRGVRRGLVAEAGLLVVLLTAMTGVIFATDFPFVYPLFAMAVLAAYRLGPRGAAVANVTVAAIAVFYTVRGMGPFVVAATATQDLFLFQAFVALLAITTLSSAAVLAERRRAEAELRLSQAHLSEAQSLAQLGSWRWEADTNRVVWSEQLYRIYGLDPGTFRATFEAFLERVHPDDRARIEATIRQAVAEQGSFQFDERIVRPDGEVRVLESRGQVWPAEGGRGLLLIGICQDVTDMRRAQRTLAASQAKFSTMFHASPVAICVFGTDKAEFVDVNERFLEMLRAASRSEVIGKSPRTLGMWDDPGELRELIAKLRRQKSVRETLVRYRTREGQERRAVVAVELIEIDGEECALALFWRS